MRGAHRRHDIHGLRHRRRVGRLLTRFGKTLSRCRHASPIGPADRYSDEVRSEVGESAELLDRLAENIESYSRASRSARAALRPAASPAPAMTDAVRRAGLCCPTRRA